MTDFLPLQSQALSRAPVSRQNTAQEAAEKLEATFLAEMLKSAGLGAQTHGFSGGVGEDQFASFQRQALADAIVERGGIGLAEMFFKAMKEKTNE